MSATVSFHSAHGAPDLDVKRVDGNDSTVAIYITKPDTLVALFFATPREAADWVRGLKEKADAVVAADPAEAPL